MSTVFVPPDLPTDSPPPPYPPLGKRPHRARGVLAICLTSLAVAGLIAVAFNVGGNRAETRAAENPVVTTVISRVTAPTVTSRITAPTPAPVTVTAPAPPAVTVTAPPATVTASANAASADPSGPKRNGSYLISSQITPGTWQCTSPDSGTIPGAWTIYDSSHTMVDIDLTTIASVPDSGYSVTFEWCKSTWTLIG